MKTIILGGGLAGLSLTYFLNSGCIVLEKEKHIGGLCRSYELNGIKYDIGPHALFSKNKNILTTITSLIDAQLLKRSNKIYYKYKFIKYPFENDLFALEEAEREYCLKEFLCNPYEKYPAHNMLQFFLKTFGEGITKLYLQPYNEKIWKFDPAFMDTQMVERIPKPPKEDVVKSAQGIPTEGYLHQLHFHYPRSGGIQALVSSLAALIAPRSTIIYPVSIQSIVKTNGQWVVETDKGVYASELLINCMPLHELFAFIEAPQSIRSALEKLKYNSIHIVAIQAQRDALGNNFAIYCPDKEVIFHRVSKVNFLGDSYCLPNGGSTILAEITYRPDSYVGSLSTENIKQRTITNLDQLGLVRAGDVLAVEIKSFPYAYVIYDLTHRNNVDCILNYLLQIGIRCCGRFAEFEYLNMDAVFEHSYTLAQQINAASHGK